MTVRTIDFDSFRAEQKKEPVRLTIGGKTYDLPSSLPASVAMEAIRIRAESEGFDEAQVDPEKIAAMCESIFGTTTWAAVLDDGKLALDELPALLTMLLETYTQDIADPKVPATPTSPKKGRSSVS